MPTINLEIDKAVFNPVYLPYLYDDTPEQIFYGGSSSGKSYFLAQRCVLDVISGGHNYLITRKVARTIRGSVFNEICKAINFFKVKDYFSINQSDMVITCKNGYQILFVGLDDVEKVKSITPAKEVITDIWEEEATENDIEDSKQLDKRLRGKARVKKRHIKSFNPIYQTHWIYTDCFAGRWDDEKTVYQDDRLLIVKTTYKDNKFLMPDDITRLESEKDKYWRDVYLFGNWGSLGKIIYTNWKTADLMPIKHTFDKFYNGLDFGFADDPAAAVRTHYDRKNKKIYITDELYERGLTNNDLAKELKKIFAREVVYADCAEPKSIVELGERGINAAAAEKGKDSVNFGIQWLQQHEIIVDFRCRNTINELNIYKWQEDKDGNYLPKPIDRNNHALDALRYAYSHEMHHWIEAKKQKDKPKDYGNYKEIESEGTSWMVM